MLLHSILWTVSYFVVILYYIYLIVFTFIFILFIFILYLYFFFVFFFSSRRRHTRWTGDWSSDVCSSDLAEGAPKIVDFGIARAAEETMVTQVGTVLGTLRYLSPEQAAGRVVGPSADIYSLGVVLDELLAGPTSQDTALLERCRANDPELRPSAADVAAALDGDTLVAPTRALVRHRVRPGGRIALLAALLVAVVVAI